MTPLPAAKALDSYFLDAPSRLLDVAAILDRIGRGSDPAAAAADPRFARLRRACELLLSSDDRRAEAIQLLFSQDYDPAWERPAPR